MALNIPVNFCQVAVKMSLTGRLSPFIMTFGLKDTAGTLTPFQIAILVDTALTSATTKPLNTANVIGGYTYNGVRVIKQEEVNRTFAETSLAIAGGGAGGALPPNCSVLVRKKTAIYGKKFVGRMYLPPIVAAETDIDTSGNILASIVTAHNTRWAAFITEMTTNAVPVYLLHQGSKIGRAHV